MLVKSGNINNPERQYVIIFKLSMISLGGDGAL